MRRFMLGFVLGLVFMSLFLSLRLRTGGPLESINFESKRESDGPLHRVSNTSVINFASEQHRVVCWVPIAARDTELLVNLIRATWGRYCDKLLLTTEFGDASRDIVKLDIQFTKPTDLWNIVHPAWLHLYLNYSAFEWFIKVDADSYFSADNFRLVVNTLNPDGVHYLGHQIYFNPLGNFHLGAGYAISRGALKLLGQHLPHSPDAKEAEEQCDEWNVWAEDLMFARCLQISGSKNITTSRDQFGRESFLGFRPYDSMIMVRRNDSHGWYWKRKPQGIGSGIHCCSSRPVLFHQLKFSEKCHFAASCGALMRALDWFFYQVTVDPNIPAS